MRALGTGEVRRVQLEEELREESRRGTLRSCLLALARGVLSSSRREAFAAELVASVLRLRHSSVGLPKSIE